MKNSLTSFIRTGDVKTEADFRNKIKEEIQAYWDSQAKNQLQDQAYHELMDQYSY